MKSSIIPQDHEYRDVPSGVEMEFRACPFNCPPNDEKVLVGRDRLHNLPGEFTVLRCRTCGLLRTNPRPTQDSIGFYYPESYSPWKSSPDDKPVSAMPLPFWKRVIKRVLIGNPIEPIPPLPPGRMLEIGCGSGSYLHAMAQKGWEVEGIEISSRAGELAKKNGYAVHVGPLETAPAPKEPYDMIVGWHVLEHVHEPVRVLSRMAGWLKEGGYLVLGLPNAASLDFILFRSRWYALQLPTHLYHFSPKTIGRLLSDTGWESKKILHERNIANLMASAGYVIGDHIGSRNSLVQFLLEFPVTYSRLNLFIKPIERTMALFGQTGRMIVWAQKKSPGR